MKQSPLTFHKALAAQPFWKFKFEMKMSRVMMSVVSEKLTSNIADSSQNKEFLTLIVLDCSDNNNQKSPENQTLKAFFNDSFIPLFNRNCFYTNFLRALQKYKKYNIRHMQNQSKTRKQNEPQISTNLYLKSLLSIKLTAICSYSFVSLLLRQKLPFIFPIVACFSISILLPHPTKSYFDGKQLIQKIKHKFKPQSQLIYQKMTFQDFVTYSQNYQQKKIKQIKMFSQDINDNTKMQQMKQKMNKIKQEIISKDKINKIKQKMQQKKQKLSQIQLSQVKNKINQKRQEIITQVKQNIKKSSNGIQQKTSISSINSNPQQKLKYSTECFVKFLQQITLFRIKNYFKGPVSFQDMSILTGFYLLRFVSIRIYRKF